MSKGPAKMTRIVPSRGRTRDGDIMEPVIFTTATKGDREKHFVFISDKPTYLGGMTRVFWELVPLS